MEPATNPNLGDLNTSLTKAIPLMLSLISGLKEPSMVDFISSIKS